MLTAAVAVAAVLVTALYLYLTWNYSYWRRRGIVQVEPVLPGVGNLLDAVFLRKAVNVIHNEIYSKFPGHPVVGLYHFRQPALLIRDPQIIRSVLVTNFSKFHDNNFMVSDKLEPMTKKSPFFSRGAEWKENRSAMAPAFTNTRVKSVYPKMQELGEQLVRYLDKHIGEDIEAKQLGYLFTTDAVSNCAFAVASNGFTGEETLFMKYGKMFVSEGLENGLVFLVLFFMPKLSELLRFRFIPLKISSFVEYIVDTMIDYRKRNNVTQDDFIQLLLKNRDKFLSEANPNDRNAQERSKTTLLGHCLTFFVEGFETSTLIISYTVYELAMNTDVQQRLRQELDDATDEGKPLDYETLIRLPYLDKVVSETLRKYPVMSSMIRICTEEAVLEINGKPVKIDVGTPIVIAPPALHNDPVNFPNPETYDPERFSEENIAQRHRYCYLPFGEGPRICIGMRFGLAQVKSFLATTVLNYDIQRCSKTVETITFNKTAFLLVSNHGLWVRLEKRQSR